VGGGWAKHNENVDLPTSHLGPVGVVFVFMRYQRRLIPKAGRRTRHT
jgi:hypothetical protein